jgi:DNA uptake protein ComE-like DNA-binding protein
MKQDSWKEYFSFSAAQRNAVIILLALIIIVWCIPYFFTSQEIIPSIQPLESEVPPPSYSTHSIQPSANEKSYATVIRVDSLFYFDPNTLNAQGLRKLGLSEKLVNTFLNYRKKGGHFYQAADIKKIYGLKENDAEKLNPYIKINDTTKRFISKTSKANYSASLPKSYKTIHINTASVEEWKSLPGIGDVLANRIVKFRNAMHGFKSVDDIKRTYGLKDSVYQSILPYLILK